MKTSITVLAVLFSAAASIVLADTFGSGGNTFNIEFVAIGNPGNAADTTGNPISAGSVAYDYRIGTFEISEQMIDKANALGGLGITKNTRSSDKPATAVSWNEAARLVNWLNASTGSAAAYKFAAQPGQVNYDSNSNIQLWLPSDMGYNPNNLYRNSLARYFLPSVDEWYKAAYYDPTNRVYYDYPTGSNTTPTAVASGTAVGMAVYGQGAGEGAGPADITLAGGLSPYGTMAQGGNVFEWEETDFDLMNGPTVSSSARGFRGGYWFGDFNSSLLLSSNRNNTDPTVESVGIGFRIASIPVAGVPGDYNGNGTVDAADYVLWRKGVSLQNEVDNPGIVNAVDYTAWRQRFGNPNPGSGSSLGAAVSEPATLLLIFLGPAAFLISRRKCVLHSHC
jgi:sulfatase modifying factor 1